MIDTNALSLSKISIKFILIKNNLKLWDYLQDR